MTIRLSTLVCDLETLDDTYKKSPKHKANQMETVYAGNPNSLLIPPSSKQLLLFRKICWLPLLPQYFFYYKNTKVATLYYL